MHTDPCIWVKYTDLVPDQETLLISYPHHTPTNVSASSTFSMFAVIKHMCSICTQVNFCTRVHICTPLHVYMHSHILKEVCVNSRKIHLGCKFNSLHLESKGKFVPEFMYFLKTLFTWQKNTQVQICTWMQKYTQVQVLHMNMSFNQSAT